MNSYLNMSLSIILSNDYRYFYHLARRLFPIEAINLLLHKIQIDRINMTYDCTEEQSINCKTWYDKTGKVHVVGRIRKGKYLSNVYFKIPCTIQMHTQNLKTCVLSFLKEFFFAKIVLRGSALYILPKFET